jgi:multiple sugar transport system substrate-binding protein
MKETMMSRTRLRVIAAATATVLGALGLAACSSTSAAPKVDPASCSNTIVHKDAPIVTIWAWYGAFDKVADYYNEHHSDVQVCWTGKASGSDAYTKLNTAISAGTGAPDIAMIEDEVLASYAAQGAIVDQSQYGAKDVEKNYPAGFWKNVSVGSGVYGIPVDGGPMGLFYRQDILDRYGLKAPTTWDEFAATAQALKAAGAPGVLTDYPTNGNAFNQALFAQAGATFFSFDPKKPTTIGVDLDDAASQKVLTYWSDLAKKGLVASDDAFTTDYNTKLATGGYAVYVAAAWGAGYLSGIVDQDKSAQWRAAPLPQWTAGGDVQADWGGSSFAVTKQSKQQQLAAKVAQELYATDGAWKIAIEQGNVFPVWKPILDSDYFKELQNPLFGGQQINKDVFLPAVNGYQGITFSPFQSVVYDKQTEQLAAVLNGTKTPQEGLSTLQSEVADYAKQQGFTVK